MATVDTADLISISEANRLGISALVRAAEAGHEQVVLRNNRPVAAVVGIRRLEQLQQIEEDLLDASLATARMLTTEPHRHALDEVLARFGYSREQLRDIPDQRSLGFVPAGSWIDVHGSHGGAGVRACHCMGGGDHQMPIRVELIDEAVEELADRLHHRP